MATKLVEVSTTEYERNCAELDSLAESTGLIEGANTRVLPSAYLRDLKVAATGLAKYGNKALISEILYSETISDSFSSENDRFRNDIISVRSIAEELYSFWVDKEAIIGRSDNLLAAPEIRIGWEDEFARGAARTICDGGFVVNSVGKPFRFGYDKKIVAAFNVREDGWMDEGFGEPDIERFGFATDVLLEDGAFGKARFEGSISELMMAILSRALRK